MPSSDTCDRHVPLLSSAPPGPAAFSGEPGAGISPRAYSQSATAAATGFISCLMWRAFALIAVLLGLIGVVVPGLPTVAFLLLAAWCGGRGWPALELWLLNHPRYGYSIRHWREYGAIPLRAKYLASLTMLLSATLLLVAMPTPPLLRVLVPGILVCVAAWMWSRPTS